MDTFLEIIRSLGFIALLVGGGFLLFRGTHRDNNLGASHIVILYFLIGAFYTATFSPILLKIGSLQMETEMPLVGDSGTGVVQQSAKLRDRALQVLGDEKLQDEIEGVAK